MFVSGKCAKIQINSFKIASLKHCTIKAQSNCYRALSLVEMASVRLQIQSRYSIHFLNFLMTYPLGQNAIEVYDTVMFVCVCVSTDRSPQHYHDINQAAGRLNPYYHSLHQRIICRSTYCGVILTICWLIILAVQYYFCRIVY